MPPSGRTAVRPYGNLHYDGIEMSAEPDPDAKQRPEGMPPGLTLFRPGTDPAKRRRRRIFLAVYLLVAALLVWPIFPMFSGIHPLIFGLPFSLTWVLLALSVMFGTLVWLFLREDHAASED